MIRKYYMEHCHCFELRVLVNHLITAIIKKKFTVCDQYNIFFEKIYKYFKSIISKIHRFPILFLVVNLPK